VDRRRIAKAMEARLFDDGRVVYFLGMGNVLYGVDADLDRKGHRAEHIRRMAEIANIMLDAGIILIVSAAELTQDDLNLVKTTVDVDRIATVWIGGNLPTDLHPDLQLGDQEPPADLVERVHAMLQNIGAIFRPW
jgi:bifunctional enzyme CysN/CysC